MLIRRYNSHGMMYNLVGSNATEGTIITLVDGKRNKTITVPFSLAKIDQSWFRWQMTGEFIQKAFDYLNADQREFLMTGLLSEEFNEMFKDDDDVRTRVD